MASKIVQTSFKEDEYARLQEIAARDFDGNISAAVRTLVTRGMDRLSTEELVRELTEKTFRPAVEEIGEKAVRAGEEGTRAALGDLALSSYTLLAICETLEAIERDNHSIMARLGIKSTREESAAFGRIEELMYIHPAQVFNWAWDAGGLMQQQDGPINVVKARLAAKPRYPEDPEAAQ